MTPDAGSSDEALTLGELVDEAARQLEAAGVEDAAISARRVGEAAAGVDPSDYAVQRSLPLTRRMVAAADAMLQRRASGEPLQYVVGSWSFRQLDLAVDSRALIPRPETEVVAGLGIAALRSHGGRCIAVDLGTGSGAIALSIAYEVPGAEVVATDRSADALALARSNLAGIGRAGARVTLTQGSWFDAVAPELHGGVDLIISNPPYVAAHEFLPAVVADWEPREALVAQDDGYRDLFHLMREGREWLAPGGTIVVECAPHQAAALLEFAQRRGYADARIETDLAGRDRAIVARRPTDEPDTAERAAAVRELLSGGLVVSQTDTIAGLLARHDDVDAVRAVYSAKQRPHDQPLPVLVSGVDQADELVELGPRARELAMRHWPGGLTIVAPARRGPDPVHGASTLGVRVPDLGWLRALIDDVGPVTGSSANLHGRDTPADPVDAAHQLGVTLHLGGPSSAGVASTVVRTAGDEIEVLREGAVPIDVE